jgi:hypothetical protein
MSVHRIDSRQFDRYAWLLGLGYEVDSQATQVQGRDLCVVVKRKLPLGPTHCGGHPGPCAGHHATVRHPHGRAWMRLKISDQGVLTYG